MGLEFISYSSSINEIVDFWTFEKSQDENIFIDEKHAKSSLAMAQISQLMPYFGNVITDEEWENDRDKYCIERVKNSARNSVHTTYYKFLAFHTEEQRDDFLKYNEQLVKDYLMIE